jgi:hypothetical protein
MMTSDYLSYYDTDVEALNFLANQCCDDVRLFCANYLACNCIFFTMMASQRRFASSLALFVTAGSHKLRCWDHPSTAGGSISH